MAAPRTTRQKEVRRHLLVYAGLTPCMVIAVVPIYWMVITAFKQEPDLYRMENIPFWFNMAPTLKNFNILFYQTNYGSWIVFFFQAEDGIRDLTVTGVQTCALPI